MDLAKKYVLYALHESVKKDETKSKPTKMEANASGRWSFNPNDEGMSGAATYQYSDQVEVTADSFEGSGFNVMTTSEESLSGLEGYFMIMFVGYDDANYGFHLELEDGETMIYDYSNTLDELRAQLNKLSEYVALPEIPYDDFQAKIDELTDANEEDMSADIPAETGADASAADVQMDIPDVSAEITEARDPDRYRKELLDLVNNDADLLTYYLMNHLSGDGLRYFTEYVREQVQRDAKDREELVQEIIPPTDSTEV